MGRLRHPQTRIQNFQSFTGLSGRQRLQALKLRGHCGVPFTRQGLTIWHGFQLSPPQPGTGINDMVYHWELGAGLHSALSRTTACRSHRVSPTLMRKPPAPAATLRGPGDDQGKWAGPVIRYAQPLPTALWTPGRHECARVSDVAVVGSNPAGLAAAIS